MRERRAALAHDLDSYRAAGFIAHIAAPKFLGRDVRRCGNPDPRPLRQVDHPDILGPHPRHQLPVL